MDTPTRPDHIKVGPSKSSLVARLTPYGDGRPTQLALGGKRAYARFLLARKLAGNRYDNTSKQTYNNLDEALSRPFVSVKDTVLDLLSPAGLELAFDEAAVGAMLGEQARALAPYSRHYPVEDEHGNITGWRFDPGGIDPAHKQRMLDTLTYLGWDQHLFPFALDGAAEILTKRDALIAMSMGMGKSRLALAIAECHRYLDGSKGPTIILALKRHLGAWQEELGGVPEIKPCELLVAQYGAGCYEEWIEASDQPTFRKPFLLVSLDRAKIFTEQQLELFLEVAKTATVIVDEGYVASNPTTQLTRFLHKVSGAHHLALSGTPMRSFVSQLLPILIWIHRGGSLALPEYPLKRDGSYKRWNEKFLSYATAEDGKGRKKISIIKNQEQFWDLMAPLMYRRLRSEPEVEAVLGVAEVVRVHKEVDLSPSHHKTYRAVIKHFIDWYTREIEARRARGESAVMPESEVLVKLGYQINNVRAPWRMEDHSDDEFQWPAHPRELTSVHQEALETTQRYVEDGHTTIVFGISVDAMNLLAEKMAEAGLSVGVINGAIPQKDRDALVARSRRGEIDVLIGTFGSLAEGSNLGHATRGVILDTPWDPSVIDQAVARLTRGVQEVIPEFTFIEARGTIQQYMIRTNILKKAAINTGLDRRKLTVTADDIPDIQAYLASLVAVGDEDEIPERLFEIEEEAI